MRNACITLSKIFIVSCHFQNKVEIEKVKQASIDSMKIEIENKKWLIL